MRLFPYMPLPSGDAKSAFAFSHMRLLSRPLDRLRYIATVLFVPKLTDRDFLPLPPSLGFFYYLIRPVRLVCKWSWQFVRAAFGRLKNKNQGRVSRS